MTTLSFILQPYVVIPVAILLGMFAEYGLLRNLTERLANSRWRLGRITAKALRGQALWWLSVITPVLYLRPYAVSLGFMQFWDVLLAVGITYSFVTIIVRILSGWIEYDSNRQKLATITLINNLIKIIGAVVFVLMVLSFMSVDLTPLLTLIVGSSLGLSLALQNPLSNLFAGIQIILTERVRPGHYVRLHSGTEGYITDVQWTDTYLQTLDNNIVSVPNAEITRGEITNYELPDRDVIVPISLSVALTQETDKIERITLEVATEVSQKLGVSDAPILRFDTLAQNKLTFTIYLRCHAFVEHYTLKHEFIKALYARYQAEEITLA